MHLPTRKGLALTAIYMTDQDHNNFINSILDSILGGALKDRIRDEVVIAVGEKLGIWPENSRPDDETVP
jgi:hypothetical protein